MFGRATIRLGNGPHSSFFIFSGLQLMFTLLYDSLNLVINGFSSGLMEAIAQEKGSREFSMRQLDCVTCIIRGVLTC